MPSYSLSLIKKVYKILIVLIVIVLFFFLYSAYIVDHSLLKQKIALNDLAEAQTITDLRKIQPLLNSILIKEISKGKLSAENLLSIEAADQVVSNAKNEVQIADAKLYVINVINKREEERGRILSFLDKMNVHLFKRGGDLSRTQLEEQIKKLKSKINNENDKSAIQLDCYSLGNKYLALSKFSEAASAFLMAVNTIPGTPLAEKSEFNLAWSYKYAGEYDKATKIFEKISLTSDQTQFKFVSQYEIADVLLRSGKISEARDKYAELVASNVDYERLRTFLNEFALIRATQVSVYDLNDLDGASKYISDLETKLAGSKDIRSKEIVKAMQNTLNFMSSDYRKIGYDLLKNNKYTEALENFDNAMRVNSKDAHSLIGKALVLYWLRNKDKAQEFAQNAIEIASSDEFVLVNGIFIFINCGNLDKAISVGEKIAKNTIRSAEFYYNLSYAYVLKGKINEATVYFNSAIRLNQEFAFAYNNLGCALWALKNYPEAIKMFREAIDRYTSYADAYYNLGIAYFNLNRLEDAYGQFERALDIDPNYKEAEKFLRRIEGTLNYQP
ncbi:MAG: tetratricopeptide repeat protein [Candidatus Omnitrophica bacterium]|nr:tetratricopeptide repeat protein [Candidatus Omnitrophota bacterium]